MSASFLLKSQQGTSKTMQDKIVASQDLASNMLAPFTRELKRRNDQVDTLQLFPFHQAQIDQLIPIAKTSMLIDLDKDFNITDKENLEYMNFKVPSIVFATESYEDVIKRIKSERKTIGPYLGKGVPG